MKFYMSLISVIILVFIGGLLFSPLIGMWFTCSLLRDFYKAAILKRDYLKNEVGE